MCRLHARDHYNAKISSLTSRIEFRVEIENKLTTKPSYSFQVFRCHDLRMLDSWPPLSCVSPSFTPSVAFKNIFEYVQDNIVRSVADTMYILDRFQPNPNVGKHAAQSVTYHLPSVLPKLLHKLRECIWGASHNPARLRVVRVGF